MTMGASVNATSVNAIRAGFLDFFARNDHQVLPSSPLVPRHDPTLMFTNAGASARPTKRSKFGFASCTPMKHCIVLVIPNLGSGGAERVASLLANYWSAQGNEVTLTTFEKHGTGPFFALDELAAIRWLAASEVATLGRFVCVLRPKEIRQC